MSPPLVVRDLTFRFEGCERPLFSDVHLEVNRGEVVGIVGLSGSGKTTLCQCISGIIPMVLSGHVRGEVLINGVATFDLTLPQVATSLGMVFQEPDTQLFFPNVEDEVAFGPENLCVPAEEIRKIVDEVLQMVNMSDFRDANPHHLSGGQKQLVALASVLSLQPDVIIFDEALSQLDPEGKKRIRDLICFLKDAQNKAVIMVDHDPDNLVIADRIKLLHGGHLTDFRGWKEFERIDG